MSRISAAHLHTYYNPGRLRSRVVWSVSCIGPEARGDTADFAAILTGYGASSLDEPSFRHAISLSIIGLAMMDLGWHLSIGNDFAVEPNVTALRAALTDISSSR